MQPGAPSGPGGAFAFPSSGRYVQSMDSRTPGRRLRWSLLVLGVWTLVGTASVAQWWAQAQSDLGPPLTWRGAARIYQDVWAWAAYTPAILWLAARFPMDGRTAWARGLPVHLAAAAATALGDAGLASLLQPLLGPHPAPTFLAFVVRGATLSVLTYASLVAFGHALRYHRLWVERRVRAAELERQLALARLSALEAQLRPHFLFNALHTVAGLVRAGESHEAVRAIASLGDLLRSSLHKGGQEVELRDEIAFAERYLEVEGSRFRGRLAFRLAVEPATEAALVPRFLLQPLVENAVRHGIEPTTAPGRVDICAAREGETLAIEVRDTGTCFRPAAPAGVGLANTRERLERLYGARQRLDLGPIPGGGTRARIELPFHVVQAAGVGA